MKKMHMFVPWLFVIIFLLPIFTGAINPDDDNQVEDVEASPVYIDITVPRSRYAYLFGMPLLPFPNDYASDMYFTIAISYLIVQVTAYSEVANIEKVGFCFGDGYTHWDTVYPYTCFWMPFYGMTWDNLTVVAFDENGHSNQVSLAIAGFGFSNWYGYGRSFYPGYTGNGKSTHSLEKLEEVLQKITFKENAKKLDCGPKSAITMGYLHDKGFTVENGIGDHSDLGGHSWVIVHLSDGSEVIVETNSETRPHIVGKVEDFKDTYKEESRWSWEMIETYMGEYAKNWNDYLDIEP
jgi:hypothetical protein